MPQSAELGGGKGFTYEGGAAAYYLAAMLDEAYAAGIADRTVVRVGVQQREMGEPLDDVIVDFQDKSGELARLSLQVKLSLTISKAETNTDFREIIRDSRDTLAKNDFRLGVDRYGAAVGTISADKFRAVNELCEIARASPTAADFDQRFGPKGNAPANTKTVRKDIVALLDELSGGPCTPEYVHRFLAHFLLIHFDFLHEGAAAPPEAMNRIRQSLQASDAANAPLVWSRLVEWARAGAGRAEQFVRHSLVRKLGPLVRLRGAASLRADLEKLKTLAGSYAAEIQDDVGGARLKRTDLLSKLDEQLAAGRLVQIRGLAGCGKSVLLRKAVEAAMEDGPVLFLKADQLEGKNWSSFAATQELSGAPLESLLVEIGATGTPVLYVDAIDRIDKAHQPVFLDVVRTIIKSELLGNWKIVVTLRDSGIELLRNWLSDLLDAVKVRTVQIEGLSDDEAETLANAKEHLRPLLFGPADVRDIVRRPFFAKILDQSFVADPRGPPFTPQSEADLIENWWKRGGYNATGQAAIERQRAIVELARVRARQMSLPIGYAQLSSTGQISSLIEDGILQEARAGHSVRFAHDIFFEWSFFHALVDRGIQWLEGIRDAGEPPAVARVVELLSQSEYEIGQTWAQSLAATNATDLRSQWMRSWLMGPLGSARFEEKSGQFEAAAFADDFALLRKTLVWFQAEKTTPNPYVLASDSLPQDKRQRYADMMGWPSDFAAWRRLITFLLDRIGAIPVRLYPDVVSIFEVWQNALDGHVNWLSKKFLAQCADWLEQLDAITLEKRPSELSQRWQPLLSFKDFRTSLIRLILKSSGTEPALATALLQRRIDDEELRDDKAFPELVMFSQTLTQSHPQLLVQLTLSKLVEELPDDKVAREIAESKARAERRKAALAKPDAERTRADQLALAPRGMSFHETFSRHDWDHLAIEYSYEPFSPPSPLREPFHSLFKSCPDEALRLLRQLSNHAITAWRQLHKHWRDGGGTPVPLELEFPWGKQEFWGTEHEYLWCRGIWAPDPVACGYLALENWCFEQIAAGADFDGLVQRVVEGHQCVAVLGTVAALALERDTPSEAVLPLIGSQRLWRADHNRMVQDLSSFAGLIGFTKKEDMPYVEAIRKINARPARKSQLRWIAPRYVFAAKDMADRARAAIAGFKDNLPYQFEEWRNSPEAREYLLKEAVEYGEAGDPKNYKAYRVEENSDAVMIVHEGPSAAKPESVEKVQKATLSLQEGSLWMRASKSFEEGALVEDLKLPEAIALAKQIDSETLFDAVEDDEGEEDEDQENRIGTRRGAVAATAAAVLAFRDGLSPDDLAWARSVLKRAFKAPEKRDLLWSPHSVIPWHEALFVARGLAADIRAGTAAPDAVDELLALVGHPLDPVALAALGLAARLWSLDPKLAWAAFYVAFSLCHIQPRPEDHVPQRNEPDHSPAEVAEVVGGALDFYRNGSGWIELPEPPPAWVKVDAKSRLARGLIRDYDYEGDDAEKPKEVWGEPDGFWYAQHASKILELLPVNDIFASDAKDTFLGFFDKLLHYTNQKNSPPWVKEGRRDRASSRHFEWTFEMGRLLGRVAGQMPFAEFKPRFLDPAFALESENRLNLLNRLASTYVCAYVFDAAIVPDDAVSLLQAILDRLLEGSTFDPAAYRAGEFFGHDQYALVETLLFVSVEHAGGAARYVNGDWSEIDSILPVVDRLVRAAGWIGSVANLYLTLCERAKAAYPAEAFADHVLAVLQDTTRPLKRWHGSFIPARIAELVQHFADRDSPLALPLAQKFLRILDMLVDMGDRRSAALQLGEAFREVRVGS